MFNNLPESINFKEDNKKKMISLAFISIVWIFSLSTSTVANIIFYDAQLEEKSLELMCMCMCSPPPPPPPNYKSVSESLWFFELNSCGFNHRSEPILEEPLAPKIVKKSESVIRENVIDKVEPQYRAVARNARVSGAVQVDIIIDEDGKVISAKAISGHPLLRKVSVDSAKQWTFKPFVVKDSPVQVEGILTFKFGL